MNEAIKIIRIIGIVVLGISALAVLGVATNAMIPWQYLEGFFSIIKSMAKVIDFIIDTDTLFLLVSLHFTLLIAVWVFKATMAIIRAFRVKS